MALVGLFIGGRAGWGSRRDVCSDPDCAATLDPTWTRCPKCGGEIMGRLGSPEDRLEMEDKHTAAARRRARATRSKERELP